MLGPVDLHVLSFMRCSYAFRPFGRFFVVCLLALGVTSAFADADERQHHAYYQQGASAFTGQDYTAAADLFAKALTLAPANKNYRYNLGVTLYKLQQWSAASKVFVSLVDEAPDKALYRYNLAITRKKLGQLDVAEQHFSTVAMQNADPRLAILAQKQLQRLQNRAVDKASNHQTGLQLRVAAGQEDGLVDPAEQGITAVSDSFNETALLASYRYLVSAHQAVIVHASYQRADYADLNDYDSNIVSIAAGIESNWRHRRLRLRALAERSTLGDDDYLRGSGLELDYVQLIAQRPLRLRLRYRQFDSLALRFDPLQGRQETLQLSYDFMRGEHWRWQGAYRVESNSRDNFERPTLALNYSPDRHALYSDFVFRDSSLLYALRLQYRESHYSDDNLYLDGFADTRIDRRFRVDASVSWEFKKPFSAQIRAVYAASDSNVDRYDYRQNIVEFALLYRID